MAKLRGLGKGLDALLGASNLINQEITVDNDKDFAIKEIELTKIKPNKSQPRKIFNKLELQELADSILHNGVIQPIVVRKVKSDYELIAGERRWRASEIAGIKKIPAIIREFSDKEAFAIALIENIQRKNLSIIEEANGYRRLIEEFKLTHEHLAKVTGRSRSHITNILRLLNLNNDVQSMLLRQEIDMGHARALLPLPNIQQLTLGRQIVAKNLTTAEVEREVAKILRNENSSNAPIKIIKKHAEIIKLESQIADKLGTKVIIKHNKNGNGKITINYDSLENLKNFLVL
ncbi:MAG TPA: ParB/RepB/Spo0J family partition protein [Burkholderiales bacterium]|nr:ParB/RepB/Spo0J family partition protein [Burkholderiales bacterium]